MKATEAAAASEPSTTQPAEQLFQVAQIARLTITETSTAETAASGAILTKGISVEALLQTELSELVVEVPLLLVQQDIPGMRDILEFLFCRFIALILVRVIFARESL